MSINRWEIADINKVLNFLAMIEDTDFATKEFTKKEFDKAFKGTRSNPSSISLDWLIHEGVRDGHIRYLPWRDAENFKPFIIVSRIEEFELPYKEMPWDGYEKTEVLKNANGEVVDVNIDAYKTDREYRKYVDEKFGACTIEIEEKKTFTAHRNFYKVDMDALRSVKPCVEEMREYYEGRLAKAMREVKKFEQALALLE